MPTGVNRPGPLQGHRRAGQAAFTQTVQTRGGSPGAGPAVPGSPSHCCGLAPLDGCSWTAAPGRREGAALGGLCSEAAVWAWPYRGCTHTHVLSEQLPLVRTCPLSTRSCPALPFSCPASGSPASPTDAPGVRQVWHQGSEDRGTGACPRTVALAEHADGRDGTERPLAASRVPADRPQGRGARLTSRPDGGGPCGRRSA